MAQQMSIDTEKVGAAINRISQLTSDVKTRTDAFVQKLVEMNATTGGRWSLIKTLQVKIEAEVANIKGIVETQDAIKRGLDRYAELAAEVDDDREFQD